MKRAINKFLIAIMAATVLLGACGKDYLKRTPFDNIAAGEALNTEQGLADAVNGIYSMIRSVGLYGRDIPVIGDLHADNTFVESKNSGRYLQWYNYSVAVNDGVVTGMWNNAYVAIMRANRIIDADVTGTNVDQIKAEAYALRGFLYFKLVNNFAKPFTEDPASFGVPIVLHFDPFALPGRNTVAETYTQIISDLQAGFQKAGDYTISGRLSKYAIEGLLAKAYLYKGDYANAKTAAEDVINNGGFTLVTPGSYAGYWASGADRTDNVETLFEIDADVINNNGFDDLGGIYVNGYQDIYASMQLYNLYSATDVRKSIMVPGTTKSGSAAIIVNKYQNAKSDDRDNPKVLRLSEVYLIAAEAAARTNAEGVALGHLNALMAQRDPGFTYASTGAQLIADIVQERRKELAFEGDRLFDLNRLKLPIARSANAGAIPAGTANVFLNIPYPDTKRVSPIPQGEIQTNANIAGQQNPGY
jgi:starch-binding outer membrane protein, SusD/RagB family